MLKLKEFLDINFTHKDTKSVLKEDGVYSVYGSWFFALKQVKYLSITDKNNLLIHNSIACYINDNIVTLYVIIQGKKQCKENKFLIQENHKVTTKSKIKNKEAIPIKSEDDMLTHIIYYLKMLNDFIEGKDVLLLFD